MRNLYSSRISTFINLGGGSRILATLQIYLNRISEQKVKMLSLSTIYVWVHWCKHNISQISLDLLRGTFRHQFWPFSFFAFSIFFLIFSIKKISTIFLRSLDSLVHFTDFRWKSVEKQFVKVDHFAPYFSISAMHCVTQFVREESIYQWWVTQVMSHGWAPNMTQPNRAELQYWPVSFQKSLFAISIFVLLKNTFHDHSISLLVLHSFVWY